MMKKFFKLALIVAVALPAVTFVGCKKGENDPAISLRSRKGRVAGEWKVTSGEGTSVNGSSTSSWTVNNGTYTSTGSWGTGSSAYEATYTFEKDGTYTMTETYSGTTGSTAWSDKTDASGTWNFTGGVGEMKNKSQLVMMTMSTTSTSMTGSNTQTSTASYTGADAPTMIVDIDQLKNKEMIWKYSGTSTAGSSTSSNEGSWTLTQE